MNTTDTLIRELELSGLLKKNSAYDGMIGESVKELLLAFQKQGHSGYSAQITAKIFYDLVRGRSLSPLTSDPSEWIEVSAGLMQSVRVSHCFMEGGQVWHDTRQGVF